MCAGPDECHHPMGNVVGSCALSISNSGPRWQQQFTGVNRACGGRTRLHVQHYTVKQTSKLESFLSRCPASRTSHFKAAVGLFSLRQLTAAPTCFTFGRPSWRSMHQQMARCGPDSTHGLDRPSRLKYTSPAASVNMPKTKFHKFMVPRPSMDISDRYT